MQIQQYDLFLTASRLLNFSRAAKVHYMTQQTFTNQIHGLEKELGVKLFEYDKGSWRLTEAGKMLQRKLPNVKAVYDDMVDEVQSVAGGYDSSIAIVVQDGLILNARLMEAMRQLKIDNPRLRIKAFRSTSKGINNELNGDTCDVAIAFAYDILGRTDIECVTLQRTAWAVAVSKDHPLAQKDRVTARDLDGVELYVPEDWARMSDDLIYGLLPEDVRPFLKPMRNASMSVLYVELGLGVALHFSDTILLGNPNITVRTVEDVPPSEVVLCWKPSNSKSVISQLVRLLEKEQR